MSIVYKCGINSIKFKAYPDKVKAKRETQLLFVYLLKFEQKTKPHSFYHIECNKVLSCILVHLLNYLVWHSNS